MRVWAANPDLQWPFESIDRFAGLLSRWLPAKIQRVHLGSCAAELVQAAGASPARAIRYLHGGAFLTCGLNTHRSMLTRLSTAADACVRNVDYRMLPSRGISDAIDDGLSGLRWLGRHGYDTERVAVAGDSSGGYLAFMTTLAAIRTQLARPAGIATVSPLTDADPTAKLGHRNAHRCSTFPCGALADAETTAERPDTAGVRCDLHLWSGQIHDFPPAADVLPEGRQAIRYIGDFVKQVTDPDGSNAAAA